MFVFFVFVFQSCEKEEKKIDDCSFNSATTRQIVNKPAVIKFSGGQYYLIEQGTIDTKLKPCSLAQEFKIDNLIVVISGDVKSTVRDVLAPCCIDNFVISSISK